MSLTIEAATLFMIVLGVIGCVITIRSFCRDE